MLSRDSSHSRWFRVCCEQKKCRLLHCNVSVEILRPHCTFEIISFRVQDKGQVKAMFMATYHSIPMDHLVCQCQWRRVEFTWSSPEKYKFWAIWWIFVCWRLQVRVLRSLFPTWLLPLFKQIVAPLGDGKPAAMLCGNANSLLVSVTMLIIKTYISYDLGLCLLNKPSFFLGREIVNTISNTTVLRAV